MEDVCGGWAEGCSWECVKRRAPHNGDDLESLIQSIQIIRNAILVFSPHGFGVAKYNTCTAWGPCSGKVWSLLRAQVPDDTDSEFEQGFPHFHLDSNIRLGDLAHSFSIGLLAGSTIDPSP